VIAAALVSNVTIITALVLSAATLVTAISSLRAVHVASRDSEFTKLAFSAQFLPYWTVDASNSFWTILADVDGEETYDFEIAFINTGKGTACVPGSPSPLLATGVTETDLDAHPSAQFTPIGGTLVFLASCPLDQISDPLPAHGEFRFIYADEAQRLWRATEYHITIYHAGRLDVRHRSTTGRPIENMADAAKQARLTSKAMNDRPAGKLIVIGKWKVTIRSPLAFQSRR
jgi:hypothetical protein